MLELEQALLREQFQTLLAQEKQALTAYTELLQKVTDAQVREQILQLQREKERHVDLAERLLEIVS